MSSMNLAMKYPVKWTLDLLAATVPIRGIIITSRGAVFVEGPVGTVKLREYRLDEGLTSFREAQKQQTALEEIASTKNGFVFIARHGRTIVGYVTFLPPDSYLQWGNDEVPNLLELGAIEVSSNWRRKGIGIGLLREAFKTDLLEDYLIMSTEYYWHWDLRGSKLSIWEYGNMLCNVLSKFGFRLWNTNDPDIISHPANTFMVRVGNRVSPESVARMKERSMQRSGIGIG